MAPLVDELAAGDARRRGRARERRPDAARRRRHARAQGRRRRASTSSPTPRRSRSPARGWAGRRRTSSWSAPSRARPRSSRARCSRAAGSSSTPPARTAPPDSRECSPTAASAPAAFVVLEQLGGPQRTTRSTRRRRRRRGSPPIRCTLVAIEVARRPPLHARTPGLPDDAFDSDGQLTKRHVRALTLAALGPLPGELLWDVGAGSGSIAIEWLRAERSARAIAIEPRDDRAARIERNAHDARRPGPGGASAAARPRRSHGLPAPDAVFIGGGLSTPGVARRLLERAAPRRTARRQRRHARGRADRGRRARAPRRHAHAHRHRPRRAASARSPAGARRCPSCSGRSTKP